MSLDFLKGDEYKVTRLKVSPEVIAQRERLEKASKYMRNLPRNVRERINGKYFAVDVDCKVYVGQSHRDLMDKLDKLEVSPSECIISSGFSRINFS